MSALVCRRCLGAHALITFDGKGGYACPSCCPPHMRTRAVQLDVLNTVRAFEAIDAAVALEMAREERPLPG